MVINEWASLMFLFLLEPQSGLRLCFTGTTKSGLTYIFSSTVSSFFVCLFVLPGAYSSPQAVPVPPAESLVLLRCLCYDDCNSKMILFSQQHFTGKVIITSSNSFPLEGLSDLNPTCPGLTPWRQAHLVPRTLEFPCCGGAGFSVSKTVNAPRSLPLLLECLCEGPNSQGRPLPFLTRYQKGQQPSQRLKAKVYFV